MTAKYVKGVKEGEEKRGDRENARKRKSLIDWESMFRCVVLCVWDLQTNTLRMSFYISIIRLHKHVKRMRKSERKKKRFISQ